MLVDPTLIVEPSALDRQLRSWIEFIKELVPPIPFNEPRRIFDTALVRGVMELWENRIDRV